MAPWENGKAFPESGQIEPDAPGSSLVDFNPVLNQVAYGPCMFQRSESDPSWADKVISRNTFDELMAVFESTDKLTAAGHALVVAEASRLVESAGRAPTVEQARVHLEFGRDRLSKLAEGVRTSPGRIGVHSIERFLAGG